MDFTNQTPVEIDTDIAEFQHKLGVIQSRRAAARKGAEKWAKHAADAATRVPGGPDLDEEWIATCIARVVQATDNAFAYEREELALHAAEIAPRNAEYIRRGRWARYFQVIGNNCHLHSSTECTTCFSTTGYSWDTRCSGFSTEEIVKVYGETACTICFPDAPVFKGFSDGSSDLAKLDAAAKQQRADDKAAKRDAKTAKAITNPDGTSLKLAGRFGDTVRTLVTAKREIVSNFADAIEYQDAINKGTANDHWGDLRDVNIENVRRLQLAIEHKAGDEAAAVLEDLRVKGWKKVQKLQRERAQYA